MGGGTRGGGERGRPEPHRSGRGDGARIIFLPIRADAGAPAQARQAVRLHLGDALRGERLESVVLLASELVGAGVRRWLDGQPTTYMGLLLAPAPRRLRIEVRNVGSQPSGAPGAGDRGLGLTVIDRLARRWGFDRSRQALWAEIDC